ncbi:hypothetical protein [Nocardioides ungokensis]|uniref:hypothetical protein n=1 Tax=Nocardioides ungokensis TaxID=1643322 RepID=UPI0015DF0DFA|nr:hypothetical protein [Nocardioides ungokensis]
MTVLAGATAADAADGPPTNTARPAITGVVAVGETVSADPGTWDPADVAYAYTWFVDGEQAGTGEQYTPTAADEGHALSVEIVASQPGGPDGTAASEPVTVLGAAPQNVEAPEVSGAFGVGGTLQVSDGTWDADGLTFTYQWMRGSVPIAGATARRTHRPGRTAARSSAPSSPPISPVTRTGRPPRRRSWSPATAAGMNPSPPPCRSTRRSA